MNKRNQTQKSLQKRWETLLAGLEANRQELGHMEFARVHLTEQLKDLGAEQARRATLQAEVLKSTRTIRSHMRSGREFASRIANALRAHYGSRSDKLTEFGFKPDRRRRPPLGEENTTPWKPTAPDR
jgi:uncharacterized protein YlxW (UPF0749 family)